VPPGHNDGNLGEPDENPYADEFQPSEQVLTLAENLPVVEVNSSSNNILPTVMAAGFLIGGYVLYRRRQHQKKQLTFTEATNEDYLLV